MGWLADYRKAGLVTALAKHVERTAEAEDDADIGSQPSTEAAAAATVAFAEL